jgi:hypothetical protein
VTIPGRYPGRRLWGWDRAGTPSRRIGRACGGGVLLPGGPERAVVPGGEVGLGLWLWWHERRHPCAARAERGPGQGPGPGGAGGGEVRPGRAHAGRESLLAGAELWGEGSVRQVEQVGEQHRPTTGTIAGGRLRPWLPGASYAPPSSHPRRRTKSLKEPTYPWPVTVAISRYIRGKVELKLPVQASSRLVWPGSSRARHSTPGSDGPVTSMQAGS